MLFTSSNTHEIHHIDRTYKKQKEGVQKSDFIPEYFEQPSKHIK